MADGSDSQRETELALYRKGDILVWCMNAPSGEAALKKAAELEAIALRLNLGTAAWTPAGLSLGRFWFDLTMERQVDACLIELLFGKPSVY